MQVTNGSRFRRRQRRHRDEDLGLPVEREKKERGAAKGQRDAEHRLGTPACCHRSAMRWDQAARVNKLREKDEVPWQFA